ncbi:hypothetical protein HK097_011439 [Rhizophlyctis rosea]|uniref:Cytochrome b-c1 complex subunit 8 n=1 Tax=Rhizophlyctis rosea TaxID=64517 RepID=A0AAD5S8T4_9FUNG|nr:hypothetical protein HK097_011439 [Rhizophlyctis rosea]
MAGGAGWWGNQSHQTGFYEYGVSPFHLKPFKGFFNPGAFKWFKRHSRLALFWGPPTLFYFSVKNWAEKKFEYYNRKEYLSQHAAHH